MSYSSLTTSRLAQAAHSEVVRRPERWSTGLIGFRSREGIKQGNMEARIAMDRLVQDESEDLLEVEAIKAVVMYQGYWLAVLEQQDEDAGDDTQHDVYVEHLERHIEALKSSIDSSHQWTMFDSAMLLVEAQKAAMKDFLQAKIPSVFDEWMDLQDSFIEGYRLFQQDLDEDAQLERLDSIDWE